MAVIMAKRAARRGLLVSLPLALCLCWSILVACAAVKERVAFRFAPPNGTTCIETVQTTKVSKLSTGQTRTDAGRVKGKSVYSKTAGGYRLAQTALEVSATRDGSPMPDPISTALKGLTVTYDIDARGQLTAIHGLDKVVARVEKAVGPQAMQAMAGLLNEEALANKERSEWEGRIGAFVGKQAKIGDVWSGTDEFPLPNGETVTFYSATKLIGRVKVAGHDCVKLRISYNSDAAALAKLAGTTAAQIAAAVGRPELAPVPTGMAVVGSGERVIDPATMLIYSETIDRTVTMPMQSPQGAVTATVREKRVYSFNYGAK
jgi:hypothetical protein